MTFSTLKQTQSYKQRYKELIWWKSPLKMLRSGLVPDGLVEAFRKKYGVDLIRSCRLNNVFRALEIAFGIIAVVVFASLLLLWVFWGTPHINAYFFFASLIVFALSLGFTDYFGEHNNHARTVESFKVVVRDFIREFPEFFAGATEPLLKATSFDLLEMRTHAAMVDLAGRILVLEKGNQCASDLRRELSDKSDAAGRVGIGKDWRFYFDIAKPTIDPMRSFDPRI